VGGDKSVLWGRPEIGEKSWIFPEVGSRPLFFLEENGNVKKNGCNYNWMSDICQNILSK
jgi:hypothetical protein